MPLMFEGGAPGRVVALADPLMVQNGRARLVSSNPELANYDDHLSIITRLGVAERTNYQALHPVGNSLYIYVFGDKAGRMVLSGLCFPDRCEEQTSSTPSISPGHQGLEAIIGSYRANRLSVRPDPVQVIVGMLVFETFLESAEFTTLDAQSQLAAFTFQLMTVPDRPPPANRRRPPASTPLPDAQLPLEAPPPSNRREPTEPNFPFRRGREIL